MANHNWIVATAFLLAWTSCANAQVTPFGSMTSTKSASSSPQTGLSAFFSQNMSGRPGVGAMSGARASMSPFNITSMFPSFSGVVQNTMIGRSAPAPSQIIVMPGPTTKK